MQVLAGFLRLRLHDTRPSRSKSTSKSRSRSKSMLECAKEQRASVSAYGSEPWERSCHPRDSTLQGLDLKVPESQTCLR